MAADSSDVVVDWHRQGSYTGLQQPMVRAWSGRGQRWSEMVRYGQGVVRDGQIWSDMVRAWSEMVRDGQIWSEMVRCGQGVVRDGRIWSGGEGARKGEGRAERATSRRV